MAYTSKKRGADEVLLSAKDREAVRQYAADWSAANAAGDTAAMTAAHDGAERVRAKYGYSGGADGSGYLPLDREGESPWRASLDGTVRALMNREDFSYDPETDPLYQSYRKEYAREGSRAAEDALGRAAALTGGVPSTAAVTAASQAGDYYAAQLAVKVPELWSLAWSRYKDEDNRLRDDLSLLMSLEKTGYERGQREQDRAETAEQRAYARERDALSDRRYADETAYARGLTKARTLAAAGDYSGYAALGWTEAELASLRGELADYTWPGAYRTAPQTEEAPAESEETEAASEIPARAAAAARARDVRRLVDGDGPVSTDTVLRLLGTASEEEQTGALRRLDRSRRTLA